MAHMTNSIIFQSNSPEETQNFAKRIARIVSPGDVILLTGCLASGKTLFVKSAMEELKCSNEVTSPTYSIANFYDTEKGEVIHIDTYRLKSQSEFSQLGLMDFFEHSIVYIEWGDMLKSTLSDYLILDFSLNPESALSRTISIHFKGKRGEDLFRKIKGMQD